MAPATRTRFQPPRVKALGLTLVFLIVGACSASAEVTETDANSTAGFSVAGSLAQIPTSAAAGASTLQISMADVVAAADIARVRPPAQMTNSDQLVEYIGPMIGLDIGERGLRTFVNFPPLVRDAVLDQEVFVEEFGFSVGEVTSFVALDASPDQFIVVSGVDVRADLPEIAPGVLSVGAGEDLTINLDERTTARPLGRPYRIAQNGDRVGISLTTEPMVEWASGPANETLADNQTLFTMAEALDEVGVVSAVLIAHGLGRDSAASGLGWTEDEQGPLAVIVLSYQSSETAGQNLARVTASFGTESLVTGRPLAELVTLESIEQRDAQIMAIVRFPDDSRPQTPLDMLFRQDGPFAP